MSGKLTFARARSLFHAYLVESGRQGGTIATKMACLKPLAAYLRGRGVADLRDVDRACMIAYAQYLNADKRPATGKPYAATTRRGLWIAAGLLFRALCERQLMLVNPMRAIRLAGGENAPVRMRLSEDEAAAFLDGIETETFIGQRDRALFELMYSSGLRRSEARALNVGDVDLGARLVKVRQSKFSKDRVVPITENATDCLARLMGNRAPDLPVFRGVGRGRLSGDAINARFKHHLAAVGLAKEGLSVHAFRHACATHLLAHGADLRYVQELLGHKSVQTTVRYTNESLDNLRRRYLRAHPRETILRRTVDDEYRTAFAELMERLARRREARARTT